MMDWKEKARKQTQAAEMVVDSQKKRLAVAEDVLAEAEKNVAFMRNVVNKAIEVLLDLQCVADWLGNQEGGDQCKTE